VTDGARGRGGVKEKTLVATHADGSLRFQGEIPLAEGGSYFDRTTLTPLPEDRVRQLIEVSADGTAWRAVFDAVYVPAHGHAARAVTAEHDAWLAALAADPARAGRLTEEIAARGATPWLEPGGALFLAEGNPAAPPRVIGDFNGWDAESERSAMRRVGDSRLFALRAEIPADARIEYRILRDEVESVDPWNQRSVEAFDGRYSELRMPEYPAPPEPVPLAPAAQGRMVELEHESALLGNRRTIRVYLPPGYDDEPGRRYPVVFLGDGENYARRLGMPARIDQRIARGDLEPLVAVFVDVVQRRLEYGMNERYRRMVVDELVPRIDAEFRVARDPARRAIAGSSRGALAALDVALARPDLFGAVGAMAPAISDWTIDQLFAGRPPVAARFVVRRARYDERFGPDAAALVERLATLGARVDYREIPEGHSRETWRLSFEEILVALFPASE